MTTTVVTCPKCGKATFGMAIIGQPTEIVSNDVNYMLLTCQHCNQQLQFVVDLQPSFESSASAL